MSEINVIFRATLVEIEKQMSEVIHSIPQIIGYFKNNEEKVYPALAEFLKTLWTFVDVMSHEVGWAEPVENLPELAHAVTQLVAVKENRDWATICDMLEYEIQPILENWRSIVQTTIGTV